MDEKESLMNSSKSAGMAVGRHGGEDSETDGEASLRMDSSFSKRHDAGNGMRL